MNLLKIEQEFQNLLIIINNLQSKRLKLLYIVNFFGLFEKTKNLKIYQSYFQQIMPEFLNSLCNESIQYCSIDYLLKIRYIFNIFPKIEIIEVNNEDMKNYENILILQIIKTYFFLGEFIRGISEIIDLEKIQIETLQNIINSNSHLSLIEQFELCVKFLSKNDNKNILKNIYNDWKNEISFNDLNNIQIPLIERNDIKQDFCVSTLQPLSITNSHRPENSTKDIVSYNYHFGNYNDLMHNQALDALYCTRAILKKYHVKEEDDDFYEIIYSFPRKKLFYQGDSLGFGMGLLNIASLSKLMLVKNQYCLNGDIVVTGSMELSGEIRPISTDSLKLKLEAFFYSPFTKILISKENKEDAEIILKELSKKFSNRKYKILSFKNIKDVLNAHEIFTKKKNILPKRILKKRRQRRIFYTLITFLCVLLCWSGYHFTRDRNPVSIAINENCLIAKNQNDQVLWSYKFDFDIEKRFYNNPKIQNNKKYCISDIDNDSMNDILINALSNEQFENNMLYCFDYDGEIKWKFQNHKAMYFGKELLENFYVSEEILVTDFDNDDKKEIIAQYQHKPYYPVKIQTFDCNGNLLCEFWNSGHIPDMDLIDIDNDGIEELIFVGTNNDYDNAILGILKYPFMSGHSPQDDKRYIPEMVKNRNGYYYLRFPIQKYVYSKAQHIRNLLSI